MTSPKSSPESAAPEPRSNTLPLLIKALIQAKQEFAPIPKDRVNPHFKSKYATLDAILAAVEPALHSHGLVIMQTLDDEYLLTRLFHESGQSVESRYKLPALADPQKFGAAVTYARRYALCAILSVTADEDDDGNSAKPKAAEPEPEPEPMSPEREAAMAKIAEFKKQGHLDTLKALSLQLFKVARAGDLTDKQLQALVVAMPTRIKELAAQSSADETPWP